MALYKRNGIWWVDIYQQGKRVRQSTGTEIKQDAQRLHDQLKHDLWNQENIKSTPNKSWVDAVVRWLEESTHKRSLEMDKMHLAWIDPFLRQYKLADITSNLIESIAKKKRNDRS